MPDLGCRIIEIQRTKSLCHTIMSVPVETRNDLGLILVGDAVMSKATADVCMKRSRGTAFVRSGPEILALRFEDSELVMFAVERSIESRDLT
jgi:hypothetical protein